MAFTTKLTITAGPKRGARLTCEVRDSKGVVRGFSREDLDFSPASVPFQAKQQIMHNTVAKAERNAR